MASLSRVAAAAISGLWTVAGFLAAGIVTAQAQTQPPPGYLLVEIKVNDQAGFAEYAEKATKSVEQYGGSFIVLGGNVETVEGNAPNGGFVVIKFDSVDAAKKWLVSPEYTAVKHIRHRTADSRQYLVEGLARK